jgi:hypothetical protein
MITRLLNPGNAIIDNVIIDIVAAIKSMRDVLSSVSPIRTRLQMTAESAF